MAAFLFLVSQPKINRISVKLPALGITEVSVILFLFIYLLLFFFFFVIGYGKNVFKKIIIPTFL